MLGISGGSWNLLSCPEPLQRDGRPGDGSRRWARSAALPKEQRNLGGGTRPGGEWPKEKGHLEGGVRDQ